MEYRTRSKDGRFIKKTVDLDEIKRLHSYGYSNGGIGKKLGYSGEFIRIRLIELGLKPNFNRGKPLKEKNGLLLCQKCFEYKSKDQYIYSKSKLTPRFKFCKKCKSEQWTNKIHTDYRSYIKKQIHQIKHRAVKAGLPYNLDAEYLVSLWDSQNGICFYMDEEMNIDNKIKYRSNSASLDRIIPALGYVKGNVIWCSYRANVIKNDLSLEELKKWIPDWHKRIDIFLKSDYNISKELEINEK